MKVIILAAGRGNRMSKITEEIPKCMIKLFGITLLDHCIKNLELAGFARENIGIVTGYKKEKIKAEGVKRFYNNDWESTNMFVSLTAAREWLLNETVIVSYSDIIYHSSVVKELIETDSNIAITYYTEFWELWSKRFSNPFDDLETFKIIDEKLIEIGKKTNSRNDIQGQFMGLLRFTPKGWQNVENAINKPMPKPLKCLDMTTLLQHMLTLGYEIEAIPTDELWLECDSISDIELYEREWNIFEIK